MQTLIDRFIDRVVPRMIEWDQGHDFIEDGATVIEIAWYRHNESWFLHAAITDAADKVETPGEVEINCNMNGQSLKDTLALDVQKQLNELLAQMQAS